MNRVGLIGLGTMGGPMASNIVRAGLNLTVFDVRAEPAARLAAEGASVATSPAELARTADVVLLVVVDEAQADAVLVGTPEQPGVLQFAAPGSVVVIHSTIGPQACRRLADLAAARGIDLLDAPISGGPSGARAGSLAVMVGGDEAALARCRFAIEPVGAEIVHVGPVGAGQLAKLANNMVLAITMQAVHEALMLGREAGIDPDLLLQVLGSGAADSWTVRHWRDIGESARVYPGGAEGVAALTHKDLALALAAARQGGIDVPVTELTSQRLVGPYRAAQAQAAHTQAV
jgi:3-hydroxyisobutyrate dehydrogenase-like beta-hydroxyacid dehydrogenase